MESVGEVLARHGGWATRSELIGATSRHAVVAAVERGEVQRIALGIYALPGLPAGKVAVLAYDGVLSHVSAAEALGLPLLLTPEKPHITIPPKRRPRPGPPAVLHWADTTSGERRNRTTSLLRTVVDCSRILPFAEALAVADAALATGRLSQDELLAASCRDAWSRLPERSQNSWQPRAAAPAASSSRCSGHSSSARASMASNHRSW